MRISLRRPACSAARALGLLLPVVAVLATMVVQAGPAAAWGQWLCSGYAACAEAGYPDAGYSLANGVGYWNMYPDHNCTNYAAYRLIQQGVDAGYLADGGDAKNWAGLAAAHGVPVDTTPTVGSIAWWPAGAPGISSLGHVAYVERVGADGNIWLSEDNYGGDFHWTHMWPGGGYYPASFLHFSRATATAAAAPSAASRYVALPPTRILDTRTGLGAPAGRSIYTPVQVSGRAGVPAAGVAAVVVNLTVTEPVAGGWAEVSPRGLQGSSNANYAPGQTVAALAVSALDDQGRLVVTSYVAAHAVLDVEGYFTTDPTAAGSALHGVDHVRLLDTRSSQPLGPGSTRTLKVTGRDGVPAAGVSAVVLNTTLTAPTAATYLQAYAGQFPRPTASTVNVVAGQTRSNRVIVPVGPDGTVAFTNFAGTVQLVVDLTGYFGTGPGGAYFYAQAPVRVADTRLSAPGGVRAAVRATVAGAHPGFVPVAAWLTATSVTGSDVGWLAVTPSTGTAGVASTGTSDVNEERQDTPNAVITGLGPDGAVDLNSSCGGHFCYGTAFVLDLSALFGVPTP